MTDIFKVKVRNKLYSGWEDVTIKKTMDAMSTAFSFSAASENTADSELFIIHELDKVELFINDKLYTTGYVDLFNAEYSASLNYSINGRDRTADLVDCGVINAPGSWKNTTASKIIKDLCTDFKIKVVDSDLLDKIKIKEFSIKTGQTVFSAIDEMLRWQGLLLSSDENGDLKIITNSGKRVESGIEIGKNIKSASVSYDTKGRFNKYYLKAEPPTDGSEWSKFVSTILAKGFDFGINRHRPLVTVGDGAMSLAMAKKRVDFESSIRMARGFSFSATVSGWTNGLGDLWSINTVIPVNAPVLELYNEYLLIKSVEFSKSSSGTVTRLELCYEDAYMPEIKEPSIKRTAKIKKNVFVQ